MILNAKKLTADATMPEINGNKITFFANRIGTGAGKDNRLLLEYKTDISVTIPDGYIGFLSPSENIFATSMFMPNSYYVLRPGENEIVGVFKICGDALPDIPNKGDRCMTLTLIESTIEVESVVLEDDIKLAEEDKKEEVNEVL